MIFVLNRYGFAMLLSATTVLMSVLPGVCKQAEPVEPSCSVAAVAAVQGTTTPANSSINAMLRQSALTKCAAVVPGGVYRLSGTVRVPDGVTLSLGTTTEIRADLTGQALLKLGTGSAVVGGLVRNTGRGAGFGIAIAAGARSPSVTGVRMSGDNMIGVYVNEPRVQGLVISGSTFSDLRYGVLVNHGAVGSKSLRVQRNAFSGVSADAIEFNVPAAPAVAVADVIVSFNTITSMRGASASAGLAIGLAGVQRFTVSDNSITGAASEAVHIEDGTTDGTITRNTINRGGSGYRPAIAVYPRCARVSITKNRVTDFRGTAIGVLWTLRGSSSQVMISGNQITRPVVDGIASAGGRFDGPVTIVGNTVTAAGRYGMRLGGPMTPGTESPNTVSGSGVQDLRFER